MHKPPGGDETLIGAAEDERQAALRIVQYIVGKMDKNKRSSVEEEAKRAVAIYELTKYEYKLVRP